MYMQLSAFPVIYSEHITLETDYTTTTTPTENQQYSSNVNLCEKLEHSCKYNSESPELVFDFVVLEFNYYGTA